jgi:hypothetical protein
VKWKPTDGSPFWGDFFSDPIPTATKDVNIVPIFWEVICEYSNHIYLVSTNDTNIRNVTSSRIVALLGGIQVQLTCINTFTRKS